MQHSTEPLRKVDYLIVGAGIVGMTIARELHRRSPASKILVLEKESAVGMHASGRNSGVLHAGFYYTADSMKARFTVRGNRLLRSYCEARGIPVRPTGKVVVARNEAEDALLDTLLERGLRNGAEVSLVDAHDLEQLEPLARTWKRALHSPNTATVDPLAVCQSLAAELDSGEHTAIAMNTPLVGVVGSHALTPSGPIAFTQLINCAGLYADRVAALFGCGKRYAMLPFRGQYFRYHSTSNLPRTNIYPVPVLSNPFLGVHFTVRADGAVKLGPTAAPALWKEQYAGLSGFNPLETAQIAGRLLKLASRGGSALRSLAYQEWRKGSAEVMKAEAAALIAVCDGTLEKAPPGIRAQLMDRASGALVMDFVLEKTGNSLHVLNAISPAFTCSFAFAEHVCEELGLPAQG